MNSCILMAQIIQDPELRYTSDSQTAVAQMLVQFESPRSEDPPTTLKVVGWGNFANEIKEKYSAGDQVVIEGRLRMNLIDRPEGFREKRAELNAYRIHKLAFDSNFEPQASASNTATVFNSDLPASTAKSNNVVPLRSNVPSTSTPDFGNQERDYLSTTSESSFESNSNLVETSTSANPENEQDLDDIPF
ncbi:MAG: single-stranded DNA-binding protein [Symploca sp. SIO3C6]|uniref:Single-stranded DNA-binding protein n=1 Tax=Symploca sp. SIO1C4 TaxID=2607765 RepID=A0A6B3N7P2_9CYAN|nr:single-stranded DNA-binding protein [Symploca sp. SIO3C6]NER27637.1 single-stranded DNA-binding protein [Symploca sp. SIO1C4]